MGFESNRKFEAQENQEAEVSQVESTSVESGDLQAFVDEQMDMTRYRLDKQLEKFGSELAEDEVQKTREVADQKLDALKNAFTLDSEPFVKELGDLMGLELETEVGGHLTEKQKALWESIKVSDAEIKAIEHLLKPYGSTEYKPLNSKGYVIIYIPEIHGHDDLIKANAKAVQAISNSVSIMGAEGVKGEWTAKDDLSSYDGISWEKIEKSLGTGIDTFGVESGSVAKAKKELKKYIIDNIQDDSEARSLAIKTLDPQNTGIQYAHYQKQLWDRIGNDSDPMAKRTREWEKNLQTYAMNSGKSKDDLKFVVLVGGVAHEKYLENCRGVIQFRSDAMNEEIGSEAFANYKKNQ